MDPATVIALCKENIQPLRHGRNAAQLGTALRAQEDVEAQQLLMQEKQMYEDGIKNYQGDDPLENWYEYILWVEQSYPKSGHESHIGKLLQQCLATFEKEIKYHQDRRYIRLWINYISMQKNPLELYQLLYNTGIGTMVADMYRAWAFELEQANDCKRADEVYMLGITARAEPRDELIYARENFQMAVGRKALGCDQERNEIALSEQRQAFSSLRAIKSGKRATNVRTGHRVKDYMPGVVPQIPATLTTTTAAASSYYHMSGQSKDTKSNAKIQIYQDEAARVDLRCASILDHVPIEDTVHKENTIKPGQWSNSSRKHPLIPSTVRPAFKVHEDHLDDNNIDVNTLRLFPNHTSFFDGSQYPEHVPVPVFVPDAPSSIITKPRYPKDLVYLNNADRSMEELRAEKYFNQLRNIGNNCSSVDETLMLSGIGQNINGYHHQDNNHRHHIHHQQQHQQQEIAERAFDIGDKDMAQLEHHRRALEQNHQVELERQRREAELEEQMRESVELERQRREVELERQRREAELERQRRDVELERQRREVELERQRREAAELERQRREAAELERQRREAAELERQQREAAELERQQREAAEIERQRIEAEQIESQRMEAELSRQSKLQSSNYNLHHSSSGVVESGVEQMLGQSLTVNTKEAMSVVQDLWNSPANSNSPLMESPMLHRSVDSRSKLNFDIHIDSSMTQQHAMSVPRHHPNYNSIQAYHDQENHQPYNSPYNAIQNHHQSYQNHQITDPYHYPIQQPQQQQQQQQSMLHLQSPQMQSHIEQQHSIIQQQQHHSQLHHQSISQSPLHPPHLSHHSASPHLHTPTHQLPQPQQQQHHLHHHHHSVSPHIPPPSHHIYNNMHPNPNIQSYHHHQQPQQQQYPPPTMMHPPALQPESQKQLHFAPYVDPQADNNKDYRRSELPYIKSPGMNRRDLKYLENADNKENATAIGYNSIIEDNKQPVENNLFVDESLGISPLSGVNDTCYTESFRGPLPSSTPMTNQFRPSTYRSKEVTHFQPPQIHFPPHVQQQQQQQQQQHSEVPAAPDDKLSIIMESTREYISSSSSSSANTRTTQFGFTLTTREDHLPIKEQSISQDIESTETLLSANVNTDQSMRSKIQAMNTQSPRTMQRNVDQITSEIKNNCDLRIPFNLDRESSITTDNKNNNNNNNNNTNDVNNINNNNNNTDNNNINGNSNNICDVIDEPMEEVKDDDNDNKDGGNGDNNVENVDEDDDDDKFQLPTGDINPFDKSLISGLLKNIKFPQVHHSDGYARLNININKFVPSSKITLGTDIYELEKCLGKGTYGTVLKAYDPQTERTVALKTQKPAWVWEFYIAREIKTRLKNPHMLRGFMDVTKAYVTNNGSILVSEFSKYGTLLAVTNQVKIATGKPLTEALAIFFTIEMLKIVEYLHKCQIIHGDIKPDNFLLMHLPTEDVRPTIQLIDYGCSIDMSLFPEGTKFTQIIKTEDFTCIEMQTGRPWTYQTDLYCVAASAHCLLFGTYMRAVPTGERWFINTKMPRYVQKAWETLFNELLNIESCEKMPDLSELRSLMEEALAKIPALEMKLRSLSNVLKGR